MITISNLKKAFGETIASDIPSFNINDGDILGLVGNNGAGKTTASYTVLPEILNCREFVNADEIAHGLSPFNPGNVAIEAGRLMLQRIEEL
jgi:predicted ABC-type ATPase